MNALTNFLESLSGSVLPWLLLTLALVAAAIFGYLAFRGSGSGQGSLSGGVGKMARNRNSNQSDVMGTFSNLQEHWKGERNYDDTLRNGPIMQGVFSGWFAEEGKLCDSFMTAKEKLEDEQEGRYQEHPKVQQEYLEIVNESERKPHSLLIYAGLFFLMAVEATGFSLIFADRLSDTASAQAVQQYAIGISIVIAVFALYFADRIGRAVYRQGYAHTAHLHAPLAALARTSKKALGVEDAIEDATFAQSIRIINRSDFVDGAAAEVRKSNKMIPRFPIKLWIYVAGVIAFGLMVGLVRIGQIDEYYAKEAQKEAAVAATESVAPTKGNLSIPPGISQPKSEASDAISQEALDKEKRGKQLAIGVFIMIFFIAQTLGVVLAAARGFASNHGEEAQKAMKAFRDSHGDISMTQWKETLKLEVAGADRYAQETLTAWQLGLQTAFTNKAIPVPNAEFFEQCARDFSHRNYSSYLQFKEHAAQVTIRYIASMPQVPPFHTQPLGHASPASQQAPQPAPSPGQANVESMSVKASPAWTSGAEQPAPPQTTLIEYFLTVATGGEQVERCTLADLKDRILGGQFDNLAALNVRLAGQPGSFVPWAEFAKRGQQA